MCRTGEETIFVILKDDVIAVAQEMGIPEQVITDDVLYQVTKGVGFGLECWHDVVKTAIDIAIKS